MGRSVSPSATRSRADGQPPQRTTAGDLTGKALSAKDLLPIDYMHIFSDARSRGQTVDITENVGNLWRTLWDKKTGTLCIFCLHIGTSVGHICVHKLRGTPKPRASRRRNHRGCCGPQPIAHRLDLTRTTTRESGAEPTATVTWSKVARAGWSQRHLRPDGPSMTEGTSGVAPRNPFRDGPRRAALPTCSAPVERVWPVDSSEAVYRTAARFVLPKRARASTGDRRCPEYLQRG